MTLHRAMRPTAWLPSDTMSVGLLVVFVAVWMVSTLVLSRLPWFQRHPERDHPDGRADGADLAKDAENWLSSR